jgi:hypothetical protein
MAKRSGGGKAEAAPPAAGKPMVVAVQCFECGSATSLTFPTPGKATGATFAEPGWAVLSEPEEGRLVFACKECFGAEMEAEGGGEAPDADDGADPSDRVAG